MKIPRALYDAILRHAEETWPHECCGLLAGKDAIDEIIRITNAAEEMKAEQPEEFTRSAEMGYVMDPKQMFAAWRRTEDAGRSILAIYHSHVEVGAYFSAEDRSRALFEGEPQFPGVLYIVADVRKKRGEGAKAFAWDGAARDFVEVPLEIG